ESGLANFYRFRIDESGVANKNIDAEAGESFGGIVVRNPSADAPHALHDFPKIRARALRHVDAKLTRAPQLGHDAGGTNQRFGRDAADVEAIAAHQMLLDQRNARSQTSGS